MRIARLRLPNSSVAYAELVGAEAALFDRAPWLGGTKTGASIAWESAMLLAPVEPSKILCVGRNYAEHAKEMGHSDREPPFFFMKPADAVVPPGGSVPYPPATRDYQHEVELVVALGRGGAHVPEIGRAHV